MIRVAVTGAAGRMGAQLVRLIHEEPGASLVAAAEHPDSPAVGRDAGELAGVGTLGVPIRAGLEACLGEADVVVDFTSAAATMAHVDQVCRAGKAIVIGSTGLTAGEKAEIAR
ncbi:MAG TPA: 4-hydroxy-tetrahydrodipicolinate reductase, partial [Deferrisomatales bacterium]|nr:4-hydroxy-tetrahydrodipicolinate reductase [Deferrisomatales bacterium]